jgi:DNA-binding FadR family transcriptional regulator
MTTPRGKGRAHDLAGVLRAQLHSQALKAGDKLPTESVLMQTHGVSRSVVREAISHLQAEGWVQTQHGVGTFVLAREAPWRFDFDAGHAARGPIALEEMLELRTSVESDAAVLAARRRSDAQLQAMRQALADFDRELAAEAETAAADFRFHLAIAEATGNRYFKDLMGSVGLAGILPALTLAASLDEAQHRRQLQKVQQEHLDILQAIERQDGASASAAMRTHLSNSRERLRQMQQALGARSAGSAV